MGHFKLVFWLSLNKPRYFYIYFIYFIYIYFYYFVFIFKHSCFSCVTTYKGYFEHTSFSCRYIYKDFTCKQNVVNIQHAHCGLVSSDCKK